MADRGELKTAVGRVATQNPGWTDDQCKAVLVQHDLKATTPRIVLLRELSRRKTPVSHAEIYEVLEAAGIDRVTLYRNLQTLSEAGILMRIETGDRTWRFELLRSHNPAQHPEHAHFVCVGCGTIACLPEDAVTLRLATLRATAIEVQIKGHCRGCSATR